MFADSLLSAERSRRGWTTLLSLALQALGLTALFILPLLYNEGMPQLHLRGLLLSPPAAAPAMPRPMTPTIPIVDVPSGAIMAPRQVPLTTYTGPDVASAPVIPMGGASIGVDHGAGGRDAGGIASLLSRVIPPSPVAPTATKAPAISRWMEGNLFRKVQPIYPVIAKNAGIQGSVVLRALINRQGKIEQVNVINGHPMLVKAAIDAVSQWLYRPYYLNGEPIEVETQVTVNFVLGH
jgi:protein TonB